MNAIGGVSDSVTQALHVALNGLDARQRAISSNVANLETPDYHAHKVDFEDSLRSAVDHGDLSKAAISVTQSSAATRLNGNNVDIDFEVLASSENVLRQRLVVQALNNKYSLLRTAITG
ncbi:MAG: flagellar basal-body rod protein FlgB [Ilumatobacteraceae bacterium]|nr:flagellar basal-body rod protein FlgB [Ilumatobacteraceae bacterium]MCU1388825.1 flagellar basal-body rod protein FlgB [Ilumatobacteraceae bacterium]